MLCVELEIERIKQNYLQHIVSQDYSKFKTNLRQLPMQQIPPEQIQDTKTSIKLMLRALLQF